MQTFLVCFLEVPQKQLKNFSGKELKRWQLHVVENRCLREREGELPPYSPDHLNRTAFQFLVLPTPKWGVWSVQTVSR